MKNTYFEQTIGLLKFEIKFSVIIMLIIYLGLFLYCWRKLTENY